MQRIWSVVGSALLVCALGSTATAQWSPLQAEDRGGPRYTTGNTMGREGGQSGASSGAVADEREIARDRRAREQVPSDRPLRKDSDRERGSKTGEHGAARTGGELPGAARTGR